jgi:hypothetical protein
MDKLREDILKMRGNMSNPRRAMHERLNNAEVDEDEEDEVDEEAQTDMATEIVEEFVKQLKGQFDVNRFKETFRAKANGAKITNVQLENLHEAVFMRLEGEEREISYDMG